jgi:hypothetical protein
MHDYLAYDKFVGWCVHDRLNYPICIEDSDTFMLDHDSKVTFFDCHRMFLPMNHTFRGDKRSCLKGKIARKGPTKRKFRAYITKMLDDLNESKNGGFKGYGEKHNWTHKCCLWELSYAKALRLPHNIDLMHHECNDVKSIISMCLDVISFSKDNMNSRKDLAALCNRRSLDVKKKIRRKI